MTTTQQRRLIKARQERNQRILWALQDALGLVCIALIVGGTVGLLWGIVA